ncbi:uncharacterized protein AB9X84_022175 isoform 2-T2 [Acanthopagrus schlegelii]
MFEKRSTPKMSKLKEVPSPESGVIVKTAEDGCAEGIVYGGGGKEGIFIKQVVPESPASKSLKLKEGDQILSATVYFDNMSYEDAMQIMEHAQAYRMKLCLKRKPDITETEPAFESDVIPEDDIYPPEMREQGKTKRRGDARISWPKFPSFGKGKKSRFTRSHSSSEADEQRKLELSPTTSDTESPIKSQDALKGKKRHKLKLSSLKKRGRISSSEDQDTDTPTTGQISGKILQTHETSDMLSPECLESPCREIPEVYETEGLKVVEDSRLEQNDQKLSEPQTVQHKVELITLDSTLKTEDLTVALAEKEISDTKSPDGKKKKKERSELKMKILGKDKSKKDAKAKSSPKRLKTLGASIEIPDQPVIPGDQLTLDKTVTTQKEISVPKVELDISDVALMRKSPKEDEEKIKKDKDIKQKQEIKTGPTFKVPKIGFSDIATEETIQKIHVNVEESTTKIESTEVREDPYEKLSKSGLSRTQLPKREEIEIPGMEDMSKTKVKRPKEPKAGLKGRYEEHQAETVQMSIDVDSVKEAVSKLPGYKLPKVDMTGVPIPEDIIVIDANAQRISVKTPTKVVDTKKKHEAHFAEFDLTASPEISKMTVKQPKITPADLTSEELIIETKVHVKTPEKKVIQTEVFKREDIIIPGKESIQEVTILQAQDKKSKKTKITTASFGIAKPDIKIPDIGFDLPKQKISKQEGDTLKTEGTIFIQEVKTSETETRKGKGQIGGVMSGIKVPEIDGIEYIDSVGASSAQKEGDRVLTGFGVSLDVAKPNSDISIPEIRAEVKDVNAKDQTIKLAKSGAFTADISANIPDVDKDMSIDAAEINTFEREGKGRKFKMPNLDISMPKVKGPRIDSSPSKKDVGVTLPGDKAKVKLPDFPKTDVTLGNIHVSIPEQKIDVEKPEFEITPLTTSEFDVQGDKFKVPKSGIKTPKIKGPEFDLSVSKEVVKVPDAKAEGKLPQTSETDVTLGDEELHGQGSRFKMPKLGIAMPKVRGPEIDLSKSKKDIDVTLPEAKGEGQLPDVELQGPSAKVEIKAPELKGAAREAEGSPSKFKMPTFKLPKFGVGSPNISVEEEVPTGKIEAPSTEFEGPSIDMETIATDHEGKGSMFKKPHFGFSMPKVKGPQIDLSLSQKDVDVTTSDVNAEVKLPEAPKVDVSLGRAEVILPEEDLEVKRPEIKMKHQQSEVELDGQGNKFKMPKLGMSMPKVKGPEIHFGLSKKDGDLTLSEAKAEVKVTEVGIEEPSADVEIKAPEIKVAAKGTEGSPSKFKMPSFKLPKFGVGTPNVSVKVPEVDKDVKIDGADINIPEEGSVVNISTPNVDIEGPSTDIKSTGTELDGKGGKFKMPTLGFSMPKVKGPKVDLSLSKRDVDVTLPEAKTDVTVPDVDLGKVDVSIPEAKIDVPDAKLEFKDPGDHKIPEMDPTEWEAEMDGHGGKFKMPKFGIKMPKVKGPEFDFSLSKKDRDVKSPEPKDGVKLPEVDLGKVDVSIPEAMMEFKKPELEMQSLHIKGELDGKDERFKMPKFGIKMPKVKGPEFDLTKKDTDGTKLQAELPDAPKLDVSLGKAEVLVPEVKAEVEIPELEIKPLQTEAEGQGGRFKLPTFGMAVPKVKGPEFHLGYSKKDVDVTLPEAKADVKLKESSATAEIKAPEIEVTAKDTEVSSKFKMPTVSVSMPKVKGDIHLSSSKKGADITLPGTKSDFEVHGAPKTDVNLGKAEVLTPKIKVDIQKPEVEIKPLQTDVELDGQGGKFKMPTFGVTMPTVKGPEIDFSLSKTDKDVRLPDAKAEVKIPEAPKIAMEMKAPECEAEIDGQQGKFKVPKFGISLPKVKGPDIDLSLSKKNENVTLPEAKVDVNLPDAELKEPSAKVEIKAAEIDAPLSSMKGSPSKFKMPTFKFPKFGVATPNIMAEVPDKDVKIDGADVSISVPHTDVDVPKVKAEIHLPEVEVKEPSGGVVIDQQPGIELDTKMKKPRFSMPRFSFSKPSVKAPEVDVSLPDVNVAIPEGKVEMKGGEVDMKPPECEAEVDGHGSKFKMPKSGITMPKVTGPEIDLSLSKKDVAVTLPEAKAEVRLPDIDLKEPSTEVNIKAPEIKLEKKDTKGSALKFKMPTFDLPKFGVGTPSATIAVPESDKDVKIDGAEIKIPEEVLTVDIAAPSIDTEGPSIHMKTTGPEHEGKGGKFKMPSLSFSGPQVKRPDTDFSLSKKDADVTLPEAKAEVKLPEVELKEPSADIEVKAPEIKFTAKNTEGSPSKFKMPSFKLPKFGVGIPSATIEVPDTDKDVKIDGADISMSGPHTDVDVPDVKAEVHLPEAEVKEQIGGAGIEQPLGVEVDAKIKKPRFSLPRFSFSKPSVKAPELDVNLPDVNVAIPEGKVEVKGGEVDMKPPVCEAEVDGSKLKMPKFGITMPKVTGPEIDLSLSKKDIDVTLPEAKAEVKLLDIDLKEPSAEVKIKAPEIKIEKKGSPSKFKMPTFELPKVNVEFPNVDKDIKTDEADMKIPEKVLTVDIAAPSIETEGPSIHMKTTGTEHEGKRSKFKMPSLGFSGPTVKLPDTDLSLSKKDVDVTLPEAKAEVKLPEVELKEPSADIEVKAPEIKVKTKHTEGSPSKFKMPSFKLPKFGAGTPSATIEVPGTDKDVKIDGADIKIPEEVLTVHVATPSIETEGPSIHMKTTGPEHEGKGGKFKMPSLGFSGPTVKQPDIDLSLSKKAVDVTLPEVETEVKLPEVELKEPSADIEVKAPEIKVKTKHSEVSPSKFKMPSFKLPKFGAGTPNVTIEVPDTKDVKIDGADIKIPEEVLTVDIAAPSIETEGPSIHMKMTGSEQEGKGGKFKMPSLGFSGPTVKQPDIDLSLSKKDVDVTLPEAKAEVKLPEVELKTPSAEVEVKAPEIKVKTKNTEVSPSKFKMPSFKLPKFGAGTPSATIEVPDTDKDVKIDGAEIKIPEEVLTVDIAAPSIETEGPSIHMKTTGPEHEGKGGKFKMPSLGFSGPTIKQPDIDLSLSKKDVDVTLPEAKAEVKLPEVELKAPSAEVEVKAPKIKVKTKNTEVSPSKFKMPSFKLPKFGAGTPSATIEVPDTDKDVKIDGAEIKIPEEVLTVDIAAPSIETEGPSIHMKTTGPEHEGKGGKFKMPSLGFSGPTVKQPDIDLSLSKKDVNVTLPEAKAEVKLPEVELKAPSAEVEVKAPEIKVKTKNTEVSPSKFKMPSFKLPKFGAGTPSATIEVPDTDKDVKIDGAEIKIPEEVLTVDIAAPSIDTEGPSIHMKTTGPEHEGKGGKFKMPSLGFSGPTIKRPDVDLSLSKKDVDVTLPEAKATIQVPDIELKESSAKVEIKSPGIDVQMSNVDGSPSKFKMPTFKLPKFGATAPHVSVEVPDVDKDIKIDGAKLLVSKDSAKVDVTAPSIDKEGLSVDVKAKGDEVEGSGSKFKMPKFGISMPKVKGPEIDLSLSKKDTDVKLPEPKAEVQVPDVKVKQPSAKVEIKAQAGSVEGSPSKLKMPTFTLPKFGASTPKVSVEVPDVDKDIKIDGAKLEVSKEGATVDVTAPSIDTEGLSVDMKAKGSEVEGSSSRFKMPKFGISMPKVQGPEIDLSLSKKDVKITIPEAKAEVKLPKVKEPEGALPSLPDAPTVEVESKVRRPSWAFPTFSFSRTSSKASDADVNLETPRVDVTVPEAKAEVSLPDVEVQGPTGAISMGEPPAAELDANLKKTKFSLPRLSFSKSGVKAPAVSAELPHVDFSLPEGEVVVKQPDVELKPAEGDVQTDGQGGKFKMPKFGISVPKVKGPEIDLSLSKKDAAVKLPETKAEVQLPDVKMKQPSAKVEIKAPEIEAQAGNVIGSPSKLKMPTFTLPKFGAATPNVSVEVPDVDKDIKTDGAKLELSKEGCKVDVTAPSIDTEGLSVDVKATGGEIEGTGSKFKMPKFGISVPKVKGPEIDLSLSKKDADVTLPEAKAEVQLPDVKIKQPSTKVEIKAPEIEAQAGNVKGSPSKLKMPTFTLPKFGASSAKVSVEGPDLDKDITIDGAKLEVSKKGATVDVTAPSADTEGLPVDVNSKGRELEETGSKFKIPKFGISLPKVQGPEIDLSLSKKDADVTIPEAKAEVKLPKVKEPEGALPSPPDAPTVEVESKVRRPSWAFPTFSFSRTSSKASDVDVNLETPRDDVTVPEAKAEVFLPDVEVQGPTGAISMEEPPAAELDANLKKTKFSLPRLSFSKSGVKAPAVSAELPHVDVSIPEGEVVVKQPDVELKPAEGDVQTDGQGGKFKMPKLGIDLKASPKKVDITLPEVEAEVKLPETKVKSSASVKGSESDAKSKDVGGSPLKFKMPTMKMQKSGSATYDVTVETPDVDKAAETDGSKVQADVSVNIKGPSLDIKTDVSNAAVTDTDTPKTETDSVVLGSPSKFKLPSFKMPRMSFSKTKPEDEHVPVVTESKEHQLKMEVEPKEEMKSPKMSLTTFGEILKNIDVEFDVSNADKEEVNLETSMVVHETDGPGEKQLEPKEKETKTKQETVKSPERTGWFRFPRFGLSSPSEPAKLSEKDEHKDEKSPAGETADEEPSPTCSVQSSDAFADISSAMTSEHAGLSLSSPTKVTVKYSDPTVTTGLGEMHSNVITSTTRTEVISVEPNLPEKITILSSGVSSSSEDTLQLASGKIHIITSNIQATPTAQQAKLLTDVQIQSAGDFPLKSESNEGASMTVEESPSGMRSLFGRHFFRETSSERSESKETIVITKQITHVIESSEPISGETASSIQRLRDSVHSDKMRFFDGAKK